MWSTSRRKLWVKGETSGDYLDLVEVRVNCEQNSLLYPSRRRNLPGVDRDATSGPADQSTRRPRRRVQRTIQLAAAAPPHASAEYARRYLVKPRRAGACHTRDADGRTRRSCFYRALEGDAWLVKRPSPKRLGYSPEAVFGAFVLGLLLANPRIRMPALFRRGG